ncbi:MAG: RluA family pseudouridine synthase [Anaerolineales bacterium]|nr:RluA family pseudouridine synthase [Anaerolineales bacterium]
MSERVVVLHFDEDAPQRLDKFLVACLGEFSRSRLQSLVDEGCVTVNGVTPKKSGKMLEQGDAIEVRIPPLAPTQLIPEDIPLQIVFENEHLLVVDKPAGMVVHPAAGHATGTLVHAVLAHAPEMAGVGGEKRPGVVHRLDKDTSGLILLAKNDHTHHFLQEQFRLRKTEKVYLTLVDGNPPTPNGRIEVAIGRSSANRKLMAVTSETKGRPAVSEYTTLETFPHGVRPPLHTLLEVHPLTGRTHQIRLHMAFLGCPVAGDMVYGHKKSSIPLKRHFLHAARLTIHLPDERQARTFEAPLPEELAALLETLRK